MEKTDVFSFLDFRHPVDIGEDWKEYKCIDCHAYLY
jgi:hypothetical protein